jgi:hypothetical protein
MELDNIDVLLGMIIGCIILGLGLSLFLNRTYTGYGAVVLAIGMMTLSLMITARPRVIERVKRENMLQPVKPTEPIRAINPPANAMTPKVNESAPTSTETKNAPSQTNEAQPTEPKKPQTQESAPDQKTEPVVAVPS